MRMDTTPAVSVPFRDHLSAAFDRIELAHEQHRGDRPPPTVAERFGPLLPGTLTVVTSSEPALADRAALTVADGLAVARQTPVVLADPTTDPTGTALRMIAAGGRVDLSRLTSGQTKDTDWPKISKAIGRLADVPVDVIASPNLDLATVERTVGDVTARQGVPVVVLMGGHLFEAAVDRPTRHEELDDLAASLKLLARRTSSAVLVAFTTTDPGAGRLAADTHIGLTAGEYGAVHADVWSATGSHNTIALIDLPAQTRVAIARPV